jgi:hypothetical protein
VARLLGQLALAQLLVHLAQLRHHPALARGPLLLQLELPYKLECVPLLFALLRFS